MNWFNLCLMWPRMTVECGQMAIARLRILLHIKFGRRDIYKKSGPQQEIISITE